MSIALFSSIFLIIIKWLSAEHDLSSLASQCQSAQSGFPLISLYEMSSYCLNVNLYLQYCS